MVIYLILLLPTGLSDLPKSATGSRIAFYSVLLRMGLTCAPVVTNKAVVSYTAFPPLPENWRFISVALALESPPPDVIRHPALRSPDFPHLTPFGIVSRDHLFYLRGYSSITNPLSQRSFQKLLYIKTAPADKFPQNGVIWNIFAWYTDKIIQKLQKSFRFHIFRCRFLDSE